jgi:hypothetical protein
MGDFVKNFHNDPRSFERKHSCFISNVNRRISLKNNKNPRTLTGSGVFCFLENYSRVVIRRIVVYYAKIITASSSREENKNYKPLCLNFFFDKKCAHFLRPHVSIESITFSADSVI